MNSVTSKAIFERGEPRVDHLVSSRPRVAVDRLNGTTSVEGIDAGPQGAELHDGVLFVEVDALEDVRRLSTLSHPEFEKTRVDVGFDDIEDACMSVKVGLLVDPQLDEDGFHADHLSLNLSDHLVSAMEGLVRALKGVGDVMYVRIEVVHPVRGLAKLGTELFHDSDALGERLELDRCGT